MTNFLRTSMKDYNRCMANLLEMHPVGFTVINRVKNGVIYHTYLFEDMLEWLVREYRKEENGKWYNCLEYYDPELDSVCVVYQEVK